MPKWFGQNTKSQFAFLSIINRRIVKVGLLVVGSLLIIDCTVLLTKRVLHIGTVVPLAIGIVFVIHSFFWHSLQDFLKKHRLLQIFWRLAWLGFGIWLISFIFFIAYLQYYMSLSHQYLSPAAIIILGSGTQNHQPTPVLAKRLDTAAVIASQYPQALLIASGGKDLGKKYSEADVMAKYLHDHYGIATSRIIKEAHSTSTQLNFLHSGKLLNQAGINLQAPIVAVTSDFHTLRANKIGNKQGYRNLTVVGCDTPCYVRLNVWFREYFAFISGWLLNEY